MVDALDAALRRLHAAAESLANNRKELGQFVGGAARSAAALSGAEEHAALARALSQLADVQEKVQSDIIHSTLLLNHSIHQQWEATKAFIA